MHAIARGCLAFSLTVCATVDLVIAQRLTTYIQRNVSFILYFKHYKRFEPFSISSKRTLSDYIVTGERNRSIKETAFISEYRCRSHVMLLPINLLIRKLRKKKTPDTSTSNANILFLLPTSPPLWLKTKFRKIFLSFWSSTRRRHLVNVPRDDRNFALAARRMGKVDMAEVELYDVCDVMKDKHNSINR